MKISDFLAQVDIYIIYSAEHVFFLKSYLFLTYSKKLSAIYDSE